MACRSRSARRSDTSAARARLATEMLAALACDPQIGGVAPVTAGHGAAADQQSDAAGQQARGIEQAL